MCISTIREIVFDPTIQNMVNGSLLILKGGIDGYKVFKSNDSSTLKKITGVAVSLAESSFGVYLFYLGNGYKSYEDARGTINLSEEYANVRLAEVIEGKAYPNVPSFLTIPKQNCLYLQAKEPDTEHTISHFSNLLVKLRIANQCSDFSSHLIKKPEMICATIKSASKSTGQIDKLFIDAHGNPLEIFLSKNHFIDVHTDFPHDCFSGLSEKAYIYLHSCEAGQALNDGIAAHIARESGRKVVSSNDKVAPFGTHILDLNDPSDPTGGVRFASLDDLIENPELLYQHAPDHTVICSPDGRCSLYKSLPRGIIIDLSYYLIRNTVFCDVFGIRLLSMTSSLMASVLAGGIDITSPLAKKITYAFFDPSQRLAIDKVGNCIYNISKVSVAALRGFGKVSTFIDKVTYFGIKGVAKTATYAGDYLEKGVDWISDVTPKSNYTLVNVAGKTVKEVSKITCRLLSWCGRGVDYILG